jgi:hypothetical protein
MPNTLNTNTWRTFALYGSDTEDAVVCVNTSRPDSYPSPSGGDAMRVIGTASARSHEEATMLLEPLRSQRRQASAQCCRATSGPATARHADFSGTSSPRQTGLLDWALRARRALAERACAARDAGCRNADVEALLAEFDQNAFFLLGGRDEQDRPRVLTAPAQV